MDVGLQILASFSTFLSSLFALPTRSELPRLHVGVDSLGDYEHWGEGHIVRVVDHVERCGVQHGSWGLTAFLDIIHGLAVYKTTL